jgi:hypothetical protein
MKTDNLPNSYKIPKKLIIGTNSLENVTAIMSFNTYIPILIGDGDTPKIWLNIPVNKEGTEWYPLIKDNFSTNKNVIVSKNKNIVKVTTPDGVVIECEKKENGEIIVNQLNLKPFGLNIEANLNEFKAMNNSYRGNRFSNLGVMIGIGG